MFSTLSQTNFATLVSFKLLFANALTQRKRGFENIVEKKKMLVTSIKVFVLFAQGFLPYQRQSLPFCSHDNPLSQSQLITILEKEAF